MGRSRLRPTGRALVVASSVMVLSAVILPPSVPGGARALSAAPPQRGGTTTADPVVSPEHRVADAVMVTRSGDQSSVASASDGDGFLAVWQDSSAGIVASRVSAGGEVLDPGGIVIASGQNSDPAVTWDGVTYFVVWSHYDSMRFSSEVLGARVTPGGTVLDADPIPIATTGSQRSPAVAFNGAHHLVVWAGTNDSSTSDVGAVRVDTAGSVVDAEPIVVSAGPGQERDPAVASDGHDFLVTWTDAGIQSSDVLAARVSGAGEVLDGDGVALASVPSTQTDSAVAWDGDHYLVAWSDFRNGEHADVLGARVSAAGTIDGPELTIAAGPEHDMRPSLTRSGTGAYVVWHEEPTERPEVGASPPWSVFGRRVADGAVVGSPVRVATGRAADVAFNGSDHLIPWSVGLEVLPGPNPPADDVYAARVSGGGSLLDDPGLHLTPAANTQLEPSVAWNGRTYLAVWKDHRDAPSHYFARMSPTGESLDGTGIPVPGRSDRVLAASNGDGFLLAWTTDDGIAGVRIDADGRVLDPEPFTISAGPEAVAAHSPSLASDGSDYFAVWNHNNADQDFRPEVVGSRIPATGTPSGPVVPISSGEGFRPAVAWNGETYFVAWLQYSIDANGPPRRQGHGVAGVRLDSSGTVLDRRPVFVPAGDESFHYPRVAAANGSFLLAWTREPIDFAGSHSTEAVRVNAAGRVLDRSPLVLLPDSPGFETPSLSWNGVHYLLVWRSGVNVVATRVSETGTVLDSDAFLLAGTLEGERDPAVTTGRHGQSAVAYVRAAPEAPYYGAPRVFVRFVDDP